MSALFIIVAPVFLIIGFGYAARKLGYFTDAATDGLAKFTHNFAIPCLLFRAIAEIDLSTAMSAPLIVSYYSGAFASFFVGFFGARMLFARALPDAVAIGFCCLYSNTVLLGLPITERAYGSEVLSYNFAIVALHAPLCYFLGIVAMELAKNQNSELADKIQRILRAMFVNPFVIAIFLGFIVNLSNLALPIPVIESIDLIAKAALPTALFGLGSVLVRYRIEGDMKAVALICLVSLVMHPVIAYVTGTMLELDQAQLRSAVLTASMAPGINVYIFASLYGVAVRVAAAAVLVTTAVSIFTVSVWLAILA